MTTPDQTFRAPAYPLITHDPYFSLWSGSDELHGSWPRHWTGRNYGVALLARIDGASYCLMGDVRGVAKMAQQGVKVTPTRTEYRFVSAGVVIDLCFMTPALPQRLEILSRPVTYLDFTVTSEDGAAHDVALYLDFGGEIAVNDSSEPVTWARYRIPGLELLKLSAANQKMLARVGDDLRIEWGHFYLAVPETAVAAGATSILARSRVSRQVFMKDGALPAGDSLEDSSQLRHPCMAAAVLLPMTVTAVKPAARTHVLVAYDDIYAVEFLRQRLPAYWRKDGKSFATMLQEAERDFSVLAADCRAFDEELLADAAAVGGADFAALCAISYRQSLAAHKLVAAVDGTPYFFSKENFSNGCICTVDVTYPSAPMYLLLQPALLKGMLIPILEYAGLPRWRFPFAPHDLGTYPLANGQVYGGGEHGVENQMPVEECGNMLILVGALLRFEGELDFVRKYWSTLSTWADYLLEKGYDPDNQLCTDDFAGHLAHNTNLSLKAIMALGAFSQMAAAMGDDAGAKRFRRAAEAAAQRWQVDALDDSGCYRLAFDQPGTWSQKYNLVWDKLLGLELFPAAVAQRELAHYRRIQGQYGLPLDNRRSYTKLDWILWSATLTGDDGDFAALLAPVMAFMRDTPDRVPLTDWYETTNARKVGFQARSVVGGVFLRMLYDPSWRQKYRGRQ